MNRYNDFYNNAPIKVDGRLYKNHFTYFTFNPLDRLMSFKTVTFFGTTHLHNLIHALSGYFKTELNIDTEEIHINRLVSQNDVLHNSDKPRNLMFILTPHLLIKDMNCIPNTGKYVIYQLEQLNDKGPNQLKPPFYFTEIMRKLILNSFVTFDYTQINIRYYPQECRHKLRVLIPPVLNYPSASLLKNCDDNRNSIDVLFYGSMNSRRTIILEKLRQGLMLLNYNMTIVSSAFENDLLQLISRSKVVLNIHFYENSIFENERVHSALRFPEVIVVSERAGELDPLMDPVYNNHPRILFCDEVKIYNTFGITDNLLQTCIRGIELSKSRLNLNCDNDNDSDDNYQINALFKKGLSSINNVS
jgi:hypothetical protein